MVDGAGLPLLFLEFDGTLLPYDGVQLPSTAQGWEDWQDVSNPQLAKIGLGRGPRLLTLPCVVMWVTAWKNKANEVPAPLLGPPELPVADLPDVSQEYEVGVLNCKTRACHFGDTWNSVGVQNPPAAWANMNYSHMRDAMYDYVHHSCTRVWEPSRERARDSLKAFITGLKSFGGLTMALSRSD
ncbi:hypothetical protein [Streptomyces sp. NPDC047043]|uniref:hypothetical protein n=1 Tax=Streptomyces sp. NPDC047043 TaxID=3154497 RepID=UPI0033C2A3F7